MSKAIASSSLLPVTTAALTAKKTFVQGGLCGRACPHWRMAFPIMAMAACAIAVFYAIFCHHSWLCFPFGTGFVGSTYAAYLGYEFHHLKTLAQNNKDLRETAAIYRVENARLTANNTTYQQENARLTANNTTYQQENARLTANNTKQEELLTQSRKTNVNHELLIRTLRTEIENLEAKAQQFGQIRGSLIELIQNLQTSMGEIQASASENQNSLQTQIDTLQGNLTELNEYQEAEGKLTGTLVTIDESLKTTFGAIQKWLNKEYVQKQIALLDSTKTALDEANTKLREATLEFEQKRVKIEELQKQVEVLQGLCKESQALLISLKKEAAEIKRQRRRLSQVGETIVSASSQLLKHVENYDQPDRLGEG